MTRPWLAVMLMGLLVVMGYGSNVEASAILAITDTSGGSAGCDNSQAFTATNCGAGFVTALNSSSIIFSGSVGGFTLGLVAVAGNQPGNTTAGNVLDAKFNVLHTSGTGNLQVDFGGNNFALPVGPVLFLSASDSGTWGQSQATDTQGFQSWGRADNALTIPGGTATAIAPPCTPGAGLTTSCSAATVDVPFARGAGNYSLTARQILTQSSLDSLDASFAATVTAFAEPITVPEPASIALLGTGILVLAGIAVRRK